MGIENKISFQDYEIHKVSGGDFLREKPVFCKNGQNLIIHNGKTCNLYSTTTGEHVSELFSLDTPIITLQLDHYNDEVLLVVTEIGTIYQYNLVSENEPIKVCSLNVTPETLNKFEIQPFYKDINKSTWVNFKELQIHHAVIQSGLVFASWSTKKETHAHASVFDFDTGAMNTQYEFSNVRMLKAPENFAVGKDFILLLALNFVYVAQLSSNTSSKHFISCLKDKFTRIAMHPEETSFATGDTDGKITVWRNIFAKNPLKDVYHWHQLPVRSLIFTECGSHMISGGDENVLVKWSLGNRLKTFLPRLSSNIQHIATAKGSPLLSVSTADSRILIINLNLAHVSTIQHFSRWVTVGKGSKGNILSQDHRTDTLVLSARTGHLQFISTVDRGRFLYTLDVTQRNYITRERAGQPDNVEVVFAKFTRCGRWLITAETGPEESRLKFWVFNGEKQEFSLNTDVDVPHGPEGITSLEVSAGELVATTGPDHSFRLWGVIETVHLQQTKLSWAQIGSGAHRNLASGAVDFARDGSLLAVSFGPALTLWDTNICALKCSLTPPLQRSCIKTVKFGNHKVSHLIVTGTETELSCWNLVTLCRQWVVPLNLDLLVSDPNSCFMCAFSTKRTLFIFDPASPQPELRMENVCDTQVVAALFIAKVGAPYLYFLTAGQELYCLGKQSKPTNTVFGVSKVTPFIAQLPEKAQIDVVTEKRLSRVATTKKFAGSILDGPAHALPHVSLLCEDVLSSLLLSVHITKSTVAIDNDVVVLEAADRLQLATKIDEPELKKAMEQIFIKNKDSGIIS